MEAEVAALSQFQLQLLALVSELRLLRVSQQQPSSEHSRPVRSPTPLITSASCFPLSQERERAAREELRDAGQVGIGTSRGDGRRVGFGLFRCSLIGFRRRDGTRRRRCAAGRRGICAQRWRPGTTRSGSSRPGFVLPDPDPDSLHMFALVAWLSQFSTLVISVSPLKERILVGLWCC